MKEGIDKYGVAGSSRPKWRYRVRLGKDPITGKLKRISGAGFDTEGEAVTAREKKLEEIKNENSAVPVPPSTDITVAGWLAQYVDEVAPGECEHTTVQRYRQLAGYITAPDAPPLMIALAATPLVSIDKTQLKPALLTLKDAKAKRRKHLSTASIKHVRGLLSSAFTAAVDRALMPSNPLLGMKLKGLSSGQKKKARSLNEEEIARLRRVCMGDWTAAPVDVKLATGVRRGELLCLRWPDVNWVKSEITIDESLEQTKEHGIQVKGTKGRETRTIKVGQLTMTVLRFRQQEQADHRRLYGADYRTGLDLVFCEQDGSYFSPALFSQHIARRMKKAGINGASAHSLRHTHATHQLSRGTPLATVSERLGHRDQMTTLRIYSHALPKDGNRAAETWDAVLGDVSVAEITTDKSDNLGLVQ